MSFTASPFLRRVLLADGVATTGGALFLILSGAALGAMIGVSATGLREIGLGLILYGLLVIRLSIRASLPRSAVWAIIVLNALWAAGTALLLLSASITPASPGYGLVLGQAVATAMAADLEYIGLRRSAVAAA